MIRSAILIALLASCAVDDLSTDVQDILGGTATRMRPEVGKYYPLAYGPSYCTATLISPTTFVTAAACIAYKPLYVEDSTIEWGDGTSSFPTRVFTIGTYAEWTTKNLAVGQLLAPAIPTPATVALFKPSASQTVTEIGYGCTGGSPPAACQSFTEARTEFSKPWGTTSARQMLGDRGGPVLLGSPDQTGPIVAVGLAIGSSDSYADAVGYRDQINALSASMQAGAGLAYRTYVRPGGWQTAQRNGAATGTGIGIEGLQIWTEFGYPISSRAHVCYSVLADGAWGSRVCDGELAGQVQIGAEATAFRPIQVMKLDYTVNGIDWPTKYRVYSHGSGWGPWYSNNQVAGVFGDNIEAVQIQPQTQIIVVPPGGTGLN